MDFFENTADPFYSTRQSLVLGRMNNNDGIREDGKFRSVKGLSRGISTEELWIAEETSDGGEIEATSGNDNTL